MSLKDNLKKARKSKGLSQQQLADAVGISRSKIASYEVGNTEPNLLALISLAEKLGISIDELVSSQDENSANVSNLNENIIHLIQENKKIKNIAESYLELIKIRGESIDDSDHELTKDIYDLLNSIIMTGGAE